MRKALFLAAAFTVMSLGAAEASVVTDPVGDFAVNYTGPHDADLDVTRFSVDFDVSANAYTLVGTMDGPINTAGTDLYVIGVNTGTGHLHPFAVAPDVHFDQAIVVNQQGVTTIAGHQNLTADISGNSFMLVVPLSDLPTTGFAADRYTFNLWPKTASGQIADFAPDNSNIAAIPEPSAWALMLTGVAGIGLSMRLARRKMAAAAA